MLKIFLKNGFKKYMPLIWGLILIQIIAGIPLFYSLSRYTTHTVTPVILIALAAGAAIFFCSLYFMFKNIFDMICDFFETEKLGNLKIFKSLLILGVVNIIPFFVFNIFAEYAIQIFGIYTKIVFLIFNLIYYLSLGLSLASVVYWADKSTIVAILSGVKVFYKKILICAPLFFGFYILNRIIVWFLCFIICMILFYFKAFKGIYLDCIHDTINIYSLYMIAPLYLGTQVIILKKFESKNE